MCFISVNLYHTNFPPGTIKGHCIVCHCIVDALYINSLVKLMMLVKCKPSLTVKQCAKFVYYILQY